MADKKVNLVCVACGYETKDVESEAGSTCPQCHAQVLNVKTPALSKWSNIFKSKRKQKKSK